MTAVAPIRPGPATTAHVRDLKPGMDFRQAEHRRETFLRFYRFHLRWRSHPGAVYYLIPYLRARLGWDPEEALWFAFLNGNTQNPVVSLMLHRRFPVPATHEAMTDWFAEHHPHLPYDTDRRHHKKMLGPAAAYYAAQVGASQASYWRRAAEGGFAGVWAKATAIPGFGRLSAFSYAEYLRICGVAFDCDTLLLDDRDGSRSHRNGLCKVLGRDDLDWHDSNPGFDGRYPPEVIEWLEAEAADLLAEARKANAGTAWERDVSYFTLESALCTYKSWHRPNRRYPNVYNDMLIDRIRAVEKAWPAEPLDIFWQARETVLARHLRAEAVPADPGVHPAKQNHYREHGVPVMMHREWDCFRNPINDAIDAGTFRAR